MLSDGTILVASGGIERSADGGETWASVCPRDDDDPCRGPYDAPHGFLELPPGHPHAGRVLAGRHIFSDDRGATWTNAAHDGSPGFSINAFALLPSGRVLAAGEWGTAASDDGGASWQVSPLQQVGRYELFGIAAFATPGSVQSGQPACGLADPSLCEGAVAIGTDAQDYQNRVWLTNDGGRSWTLGPRLAQLYDGTSWPYVAGLFEVGRDAATGLGQGAAVLGRGFVFTTADGGATWNVVARAPVVAPQIERKSVLSALVDAQGRLIVGVSYYNFANGEGEWVYRTREPVVSAFAVAGEAPPEASERVGVSVRPNPAGGRVEVLLTLAEAGAARVVVVDALGREVAVVLDGAVPAGETVAALETGAWPAGAYAVRASVGGRTATARLVVAR